MKKIAFFSLLFLLTIGHRSMAQDGYTRVIVSGGILHRTAGTGTVALEFGKKYHRYIELFADVYRSNLEERENYLAGIAYKPNLLRSSNTYLNFRAGFGLGSNTDNVIGSIQGGFEFGYIFPKNFALMLHQKNEAVIGSEQPLRTGILVGFKIPL